MKQDITITRSRTIDIRLYVEDSNGAPYVLGNGEKLIFGVKNKIDDTEYVLSKEATSSNYSNGYYTFSFAHTDTKNLAPKTYFYDVGLQGATTYKTVIETSRFVLEGNVTIKEESQSQ